MTTKEALHRLVDELSERQAASVHRLAERVRDSEIDPVLLAMLTAPLDDEPETDEERAAVAEAREDVAAGRLVAHDEARRRILGEP
jgi:hypothetical protein